jgi:hypothetical protein
MLTPFVEYDLDRDPAAWKIFTPEDIQRRRMVFWMVYATDASEVRRGTLSLGSSDHLRAL